MVDLFMIVFVQKKKKKKIGRIRKYSMFFTASVDSVTIGWTWTVAAFYPSFLLCAHITVNYLILSLFSQSSPKSFQSQNGLSWQQGEKIKRRIQHCLWIRHSQWQWQSKRCSTTTYHHCCSGSNSTTTQTTKTVRGGSESPKTQTFSDPECEGGAETRHHDSRETL